MKYSILKLLLIGWIGINTLNVSAQTPWLPLDEALGKAVISETVTNQQQLLVLSAQKSIGFRQATLTLSKWNNQFWTTYPAFEVGGFFSSTGNEYAIAEYNQQPVIAGSFKSDDGTKTGIVTWNGSTWTTLAGGIESNYLIHPEISIADMLDFKGDLYVCGDFNIANKKAVHNFVVLKGGNWQNIETGKGIVNDLQVVNDTLFAAGRFNTIDGKPAQNIGIYTAGQWKAFASPASDEILSLTILDGHLVAFTQNNIYEFAQNTWQNIGSLGDYKIEYLGSVTTYKGGLYLAGAFKDKSGITVHLLGLENNKSKAIITQNDVFPKGQMQYYVSNSGNELIFSGSITGLFGKPVSHAINILPKKTLFEGQVYNDLNGNCKHEVNEPFLNNALLSLNNNFFTSTDASGAYHLVLEPNTSSQLNIYPADTLESKCVPLSTPISSNGRDSIIRIDFPLRVKNESQDLSVSLLPHTGNTVALGQVFSFTIKTEAKPEMYPIRVTLAYDKRIDFLNSEVQPVNIAGGLLEWELSGNTAFVVRFKTNAGKITLGDSLVYKLSGISKSKHVKSETVCKQIVVESYDGNTKQCDKAELEEGFGKLNYHIQFQNPSNTSIHQVHVVDTIDASLPIQYIKINGYGERHKNLVSYKVRNNAIIWTFDGVNLPEKSMGNDTLSSGYISYTAQLLPGLKAGTLIKNKAGLYFDYFEGLQTNTTVTTIVKKHSPYNEDELNLSVFPNPCIGNSLKLVYPAHLIKTVEVVDLTGRVLKSYTLEEVSESADLDVSGIGNGFFILNITHTAGVASKKLVINK